jgi:hypothetical protein
MDNILELPLKKEWYNLIESGVKKEEYREIKPFWLKRLFTKESIKEINVDNVCNNVEELITLYSTGKIKLKQFDKVRFRYGYTKKTMTYYVRNITIGKGNKDWGAMDEPVFIISLGESE